ncbi:MAG: hypothetical protein QME78_00065 [Thermodesulfobacteriota bacterium]|nr:hypothetical protein [Thermodesulfobacteriota bacterium]
MAKTSKAPAVDSSEKEWRREVSFNFGKGGMEKPEEFKDLQPDMEVTALVTGKVKNLRLDTETSSFSLQMEKVELQTGAKGGLSEALGKAKKKQKL